jgi:hypothetical protein
MLDFTTIEHKAISESASSLFRDLNRVDRDSVQRERARIAPGKIAEALHGLGLFEDFSPDSAIASLLNQVLIAIEAGRACLPFPVLEILSSASWRVHASDGDAARFDQSNGLASQSSLRDEDDDPAITLQDGCVRGTLRAVPFANFCGHVVFEAETPSGRAFGFADIGKCALIRLNSIEPDYPLYDVVFDDFAFDVPHAHGEQPPARSLLQMNAILAAAELTGAGLQLLDTTRDYLLTRTQFGKPLGASQALKHRMAHHYVQVQALLMTVKYAAAAMDAHAEDAAELVCATKLFAGRTCRKLALDALQMHGAIGYTMELPLHQHIRRVLRLAQSHGSTQLQGECLFEEFGAQSARVHA